MTAGRYGNRGRHNTAINLSRRDFLTSAAAGGLALFGFTAAALGKTVSAAGPCELSKASFEVSLGSRFTVHTSKGLCTMWLTEVRDNGSDDKLEQFTVAFHLQRQNDGFPQDVYEVFWPTRGEKLSLLLSPGESADVITAAFCNLK